MIKGINRKLSGWANFYQYTDFTAKVYAKADGIIFWKLAHWLAKKYRTSIKQVVMRWFCSSGGGAAKTWRVYQRKRGGNVNVAVLRRLVSSRKLQFRYRNPETNPYLKREDIRNTVSSRYRTIAMAMSHC